VYLVLIGQKGGAEQWGNAEWNTEKGGTGGGCNPSLVGGVDKGANPLKDTFIGLT